MGNKLIDIQSDIKSKEVSFRKYFEENLDEEVLNLIYKLEEYSSVYLFSGIIRDFFVSPNNSFRDIDLIYDTDNNLVIEELFLDYKFNKNSFGGYKILINNYTVDIWNLKDTWGLKKGQLTFEFNYLNKLPDTAFFNFSSIVYSLNENSFIIGKPFLNFLQRKEIDLVMEENPFPELCVINTIYFKKRLNFKLSNKLIDYITNQIEQVRISDLFYIQIKHYNKIIFYEDDLISFFEELKHRT